MWNSNDIEELSTEMGMDVNYLYELAKTCNSLMDILKCIKNNLEEIGYINLFIKNGNICNLFKNGFEIESESITKKKNLLKNVNKSIFGSFSFPVSNKKDMLILTELLLKDLGKEFGTSNKFYPGSDYPFSIDEGKLNIGTNSKNPKLIKNMINSLLNPDA